MDIAPLLFHFPHLPRIHCVFLMRTVKEAVSKDPFAGGNISFQVGDLPARVEAYRASLLSTFQSLGLQRLSEVQQVHGETLLFVPNEDTLQEADGMATTTEGLGLMIKTADCQPILLADKSATHICALHVGWRGNRSCFIPKAVTRFCNHYEIRPSDLLAVRGPSLGPACAEFIHMEREWPEAFRPWFDAKTKTMDLWQLTKAQLLEAGLPKEQIFGLDICTMSTPTFFSYRRSHTCGRQASLIWIEPASDA